MALLRHERAVIFFLIRHLAVGAVGAVLFGILVLVLDIGHLRTLATLSADGLASIGLLFFGLIVTFGGLGMGIGIMSLARDDS